MLTKRGLDLLSTLCDKINDNGYKVYEWAEIVQFGEDHPQAVMSELSSDLSINVKYSDNDEICFCLTQKGRKTIEDLITTLQTKKISEKAVVKSDLLGNTLLFDEETEKEEQLAIQAEQAIIEKKSKKKNRLKGLLRVIIDVIAGGIGGGIVAALILLLN